MASIITPTLTITSNEKGAASTSGPLSFKLNLSTTVSYSCDLVDQNMYTLPIDTGDGTFDGVTLLDGSAKAEINGANANGITGNPYVPGTMGCFVYIKNTGTTNKVAIALTQSSVADVDGSTNLAYDATPFNSGGGAATGLSNLTGQTLRTMTLLPGEFLWMPHDYTGDIIAEAISGTTTVEVWIYDRLP